jgi:hypothetical protein
MVHRRSGGTPTLIGLLLALAGFALGIAVLVVVWVVVHRDFGARRLMVDDMDIYRSANELIEQHGEDAPIEAAMRADELAADGDMEGRAVWLRIVKAIEELLSEERPSDAEVH